METIGQLSYRWPQFLLWALFGALIVRAASRLLRRDRFRQSEDVDTSVVGAEQRAWNEQPRLAVVTAASILIVGSMVSIAVSGLPVFRYKVTLVPMMLVLLAVAMPTTVSRRGRDATPPAH